MPDISIRPAYCRETTNLLRRGVALLALLLLALPAHAQRIALVIGNSQYQTESVLKNPVNDARLIAMTLRAQGFKVDEKFDLPRRDMELTINRFVRDSAGAESAVLYYAGHGAQPLGGGRNFLLPVDAKVEGDDTLETDGIAADRIVEQMERNANPARLRLVVLDACRNNRLAGKARSSVRGLSRMSPSDDYTLIAFSTNDQDVALDGSGNHSPYAEALARHLGRAGNMPLRRIFELTAEDVRKTTGQKQRPRTYGDLDSRMLLTGTLVASVVPEPVNSGVPMSPAPPSAVQLEQQAWETAKGAGTATALQAFLSEFPNGAFSGVARVRLAALLAPAPVAAPAQAVNESLIEGRYSPLADGSEIKDTKTGLIWQRCSVGQQWTGITCSGDARKFALADALGLARAAWRVPTFRELYSLVLCSNGVTRGSADPADGKGPIAERCDGQFASPTIAQKAFPGTPATYYWSSTPNVGFPPFRSWVAGFFDGNVGDAFRYLEHPVRMVRDSP